MVRCGKLQLKHQAGQSKKELSVLLCLRMTNDLPLCTAELCKAEPSKHSPGSMLQAARHILVWFSLALSAVQSRPGHRADAGLSCQAASVVTTLRSLVVEALRYQKAPHGHAVGLSV